MPRLELCLSFSLEKSYHFTKGMAGFPLVAKSNSHLLRALPKGQSNSVDYQTLCFTLIILYFVVEFAGSEVEIKQNILENGGEWL